MAPGFIIELIASELLISDPVDMIIDENGQMYVVEMYGYPLDTSGTGKIKLLKDANGDGRMDEATVFANDLTVPFGIMRWKKGLLVADAPQMLYLEDTTGDGKADLREVMLSGFAFSNAQMNAGDPIYGLDNWQAWSRSHWSQCGHPHNKEWDSEEVNRRGSGRSCELGRQLEEELQDQRQYRTQVLVRGPGKSSVACTRKIGHKGPNKINRHFFMEIIENG